MNHEYSGKVTADHLRRGAYLYVRQSTLRQVFENTESTQRQYALRERAVALGWPLERIIVIDTDLGQSGASAADRQGFQHLVSEVGLGRAGIVLGLEVSRLARNCTDWHRLLEICALSRTLILDEDGLYDPSHFNDRLLLGLKGTMSEAELHILRARLRGGIENKAKRGELKLPLPVGLIYDERDHVELDPDLQVRQALSTFFRIYEGTDSALGTVKAFARQGLLFPRRIRRGLRKGALVWGPLGYSRALQTLHNPRYTGAFVYGRFRQTKTAGGREGYRKLPPQEWHTVLPGSHAGYITWEQYQDNQRRLHAAGQAHGKDRRRSPAGEGPALLQGLVICGRCGRRMTVRYHTRRGHLRPDYVCQREGIERGESFCQTIPGGGVDQEVRALLLQMMTPVALDVALAVQQELQGRLDEADRLRHQQVERARYEADLAQQRYLRVDPNNRLVANALEGDWNDKLRVLTEAQENYERQRQADRVLLDDEGKARVYALITDFPDLWCSPKTPDRERKRMVRLLIEDVTLLKGDGITMHVRFKGGMTRTVALPIPPCAWEERQTKPEVVSTIDCLLEECTESQIAERLNALGLMSGTGREWTCSRVTRIRRNYHLASRYERLRKAGMLTHRELAEQLGVSPPTVKIWRSQGLLRGHLYNEKNQYLYEPVEGDRPTKSQGKKLSERRRFSENPTDRTDEV
jgi:DNA invertase Pin-like site-specific DNA recombinase